MNWTKYSPCILILGLGGCSSKMKQSEVHTNLCLIDSLLKIVPVGTVRLHDMTDEPVLNGRVTLNQEQVAYTYPMFGGTMVELHAEVGDYVRKGDTLVVICSGEVADYEKQTKEANQQVIIARRNMDVTQDTFDSGLVSNKDVLQVQQELANAEAEENRIKEIFSTNHSSGRSSYEIKFLVSGFIIDKKVGKDMQPRSDQSGEIFTVPDPENVWVMVDIYESDVSRVVEGAPIHITILVYPDRVLSGSINKVYYMLDTKSKTMDMRIKLRNGDYLLKPGMSTNAGAECKSFGKQMPRIDAHVLIFEGGKNYVVAVVTDHHLSIREIDVYKQPGKECYIRSGLSEGDRVLNQNVLLVYNVLNAD